MKVDLERLSAVESRLLGEPGYSLVTVVTELYDLCIYTLRCVGKLRDAGDWAVSAVT